MNEIAKILLFMVSCVLSNNYIFSRFLGCCPFLGVSSKVETAAGMGVAVTFVMAIASLFTKLLYDLVLAPLNLEYLNTISFIIVIAGLVQLVEMFIKKASPSLYKALGIYLPLITTNCAVLGCALVNIQNEFSVVVSVCYGFAAAIGFALAIVVFAGVRARMEFSDPPEAFRGFPLTLVAAGLLAMAFSGFSGMSF